MDGPIDFGFGEFAFSFREKEKGYEHIVSQYTHCLYLYTYIFNDFEKWALQRVLEQAPNKLIRDFILLNMDFFETNQSNNRVEDLDFYDFILPEC